MKDKKSIVFILKEQNWVESDFKDIKMQDIFCFDIAKNEAFTASCDPFFNFDGIHADKWSVLLTFSERKKKKDFLEILEGK
ncbi:MAG: hypothetical protein AABY22_13595 [Nanoarchaeota archaeon]